MRALLWIVLALAALWSGYWWVGSTEVQRGAVDWFAAQSARGLVSEQQGIAVRGFPNRFDLTVTGLRLADPAQGIGWDAPFVQIFAMTWKPWHLIAALPNSQDITVAGQVVSATSSHMLASVLLHPGADLALNETRFDSAAVGLASSQGWALTAEQITASTLQDATRGDTHRLGLLVKSVVLGDLLAQAVAGADLPATLTRLHLDASVRLSAPLDRHAARTKPAVAALDLAEASVEWGALRLMAKGGLVADDSGVAEGEIAIRITGWRRLPPLLAALGAIKPQLAPTVLRALEVMAEGATDPDVLDVTLKAANGRLSLGPLPLGPAPQLN